MRLKFLGRAEPLDDRLGLRQIDFIQLYPNGKIFALERVQIVY